MVQVRRIQSPVVNARLPARSRLVSGSMSQRGSERVPGSEAALPPSLSHSLTHPLSLSRPVLRVLSARSTISPKLQCVRVCVCALPRHSGEDVASFLPISLSLSLALSQPAPTPLRLLTVVISQPAPHCRHRSQYFTLFVHYNTAPPLGHRLRYIE